MHNYLKNILQQKRVEVEQLKSSNRLLGDMERKPKSLKSAFAQRTISIIAEIKRKSPSKPFLANIDDPVSLAYRYVRGGARAISVLTDQFGFNGSLADLQLVADALKDSPAPILRKDFIIDLIQIKESFIYGADALLLIVAVLKERTADFLRATVEMGMEALVEVHNKEELDYAVSIGAEIIGINNRNLTTFQVDIANGLKLLPHLPNHVVKVAESGIINSKVAKVFKQQGFNALLIGEALVKATEPENFIQEVCEG